MNASKKTIQFTAIASAFLLVLTYLVTVNIETSFISMDSPWISNSFFLTFFGGAFASMVVVLICEISKYWQVKQSAEAYLFSHLYYLYGQLQIIAKNINWLQTQELCHVHEASLKQLIANATAEMNAIYFAEYSPFCKQNAVFQEKQKYNTEVFYSVQKFLQDCEMFELAVLEDNLEKSSSQLEGRQCRPAITPMVLQRLSELIVKPTQSVDSLMGRIEKSCKGRYNWATMKADFLQRLPDNQNDALDRFLQNK